MLFLKSPLGTAARISRFLRPNAYEIDRCHVWFDVERAIIKLALAVAPDATAVHSVCGRPPAINKIRGHIVTLEGGGRVLATVHPSYILRIRDTADKREQYRQPVADLKVVAGELARAA